MKVLPDAFVTDPERLARFQREAEVLASLNHRNIAQIYGLEDSGDTTALVLELVEGPTLADRIAEGAIPIGEAIDIAKQITEALEAAHALGIIHRDLKPANIKITPDGVVKVLDFGLAKALADGGTELSQSPTLTKGTAVGVILGTAAYMSPEQAKGKSVDRRTDVWAFGAVLYEMLTGQSAFSGESVSEVLASVLKDEPDFEALPGELPPGVRRVLVRALRTDPSKRLRDIGDARLEIEERGDGTDERTAADPPLERHRLAAVGAACLVLGLIAGAFLLRTPRERPRVSRFVLSLPPGDSLIPTSGSSPVAISLDGGTIIYAASREGVAQLFLRALDELAARPLPGTEGGSYPFFSPNGAWVGFVVSDRLMKVRASGEGAAIDIGPAPGMAGGAWGEDDAIWLGAHDGSLRRIPASGGEPETMGRLGDADFGHDLPQVLPDGRTVLVAIDRGANDVVALHSIDTGETVDLLPGQTGRYSPSGHLLVTRGGSLLAAPFDVDELRILRDPSPVLEGVHRVPRGGALGYDVGADGTFVYVTEGSGFPERRPAWLEAGGTRPMNVPVERYLDLTLSPDGARLALVRGQNGELGISILDLERGTLVALAEERDISPVWSPDGRRIALSHWEGNRFTVAVRSADATGGEERLLDRMSLKRPQFWTPDGTGIVFVERDFGDMSNERALLLVSVDGARDETALLRPSDVERGATLSPNGRYMAYETTESGRSEVFVRPFPDVDTARWIVSSGGGTSPHWVDDGRRIVYRGADAIMEVDVTSDSVFVAGRPRVVVDAPPMSAADREWIERDMAVTPDGERIVVLENEPGFETRPQQIVVVTNWFEELKVRVPLQ